jgi:hypothetical protein
MRSLSSLSVQSARCSRTAHATRASISAAGAPPQRWNDVPRGTMRLPRASKINPVRRDPVSSRDLRRAPRLAASRACKDHTDAVGLVGIGHQFAILNVIAQWDRAAHPHALAARCRKFVAATVTLCWRRKASHFWEYCCWFAAQPSMEELAIGCRTPCLHPIREKVSGRLLFAQSARNLWAISKDLTNSDSEMQRFESRRPASPVSTGLADSLAAGIASEGCAILYRLPPSIGAGSVRRRVRPRSQEAVNVKGR